MPFSDDYAPTFSNDENGSGDIFGAPDVVRQSPTTSERVVDTQSGFLVVVKRVDSRFSLSVKRRIGTPPASSILLTPDESIKLSKILGSASAEYRSPNRVSGRSARSAKNIDGIEGWLAGLDSVSQRTSAAAHFNDAHDAHDAHDDDDDDDDNDNADAYDGYGANASANANASAYPNASTRAKAGTRAYEGAHDDHADADAEGVEPGQIRDPHSRSFSARRPRSTRRKNSEPFNFPLKAIGIGAASLVVAIALALGGYKMLTAKHAAPQAVEAAKPAVDVEAAETERVNKFARAFVSDMLDFNPATYRVSQVHAMANMAPELLEKYWNETHFPLTPAQLKGLSQSTTLMITKVDQQRIDELSRQVDLYAELVSANSKMSNPVHLQLKVATGDDGQLRVLEQKDLSAKK